MSSSNHHLSNSPLFKSWHLRHFLVTNNGNNLYFYISLCVCLGGEEAKGEGGNSRTISLVKRSLATKACAILGLGNFSRAREYHVMPLLDFLLLQFWQGTHAAAVNGDRVQAICSWVGSASESDFKEQPRFVCPSRVLTSYVPTRLHSWLSAIHFAK